MVDEREKSQHSVGYKQEGIAYCENVRPKFWVK